MNVTVVKLIAALTLGLFTAPLVAGAQQAGKVHRIGYLSAGSPSPLQPLRPVFEQALRERGWVTGENLVIAYRYAEEKCNRLPGLAAELVWGVADPISEGHVASFARPGGNVTGFTGTTFETFAEQLQLLKEAVPRARRIAFLRDPANLAALPGVKTVKEAARTFGVELQVVDARSPGEFEPAFRAMVQARADALLVYPDVAFYPHLGRLADLSVRNHLPTMCGADRYAKAGGLHVLFGKSGRHGSPGRRPRGPSSDSVILTVPLTAPREETMSAGSAEQKVLEVIEKLPADATLEDAIERLVLLAKTERGLVELDAGQGVDHAEAKRRLLR